ncbi:MAG: hypothetical protein ACRDK2_02140 [Solirubrobacteraceae bacterium]
MRRPTRVLQLLGLLRLPVPVMVAALAAQAFIVTQIGVRLGTMSVNE